MQHINRKRWALVLTVILCITTLFGAIAYAASWWPGSGGSSGASNQSITHIDIGVHLTAKVLLNGHLKALERANKRTGIEYFNIGTGKGYSVLELVSAYEKASGVKINYLIAPRRPGDIAKCYADPHKAHKLLGWTAENDIDDMCRDMANWQTKNPNGYEGD